MLIAIMVSCVRTAIGVSGFHNHTYLKIIMELHNEQEEIQWKQSASRPVRRRRRRSRVVVAPGVAQHSLPAVTLGSYRRVGDAAMVGKRRTTAPLVGVGREDNTKKWYPKKKNVNTKNEHYLDHEYRARIPTYRPTYLHMRSLASTPRSM